MDIKKTSLVNINRGDIARIIDIQGGLGFKRRLNVLGVREGQIVRIISRQPLQGPLTIAVGNCQMTLGRGMAQKIFVEVI